MTFSNADRWLLGTALVFFTLNALLLNDIITPWAGAEGQLLLAAREHRGVGWLPFLLGITPGTMQGHVFAARMWGIVCGLASLGVVWGMGRRLFGRPVTLAATLIFAAAWLPQVLGKLASADSWLLFAHTAWLLVILQVLKGGNVRQWLLANAFLLLGLSLNPVSTLILAVGSSLLLRMFHPQGKQLLNLRLWLGLLGIPVLAVTTGLDWSRVYSYFGWGTLSGTWWAVFIFIGMLPFWGFALAGCWDSLRKFRKNDEWSIVLLVYLVGALASQSPAIALPIALWAGRHLQDYMLPNYPLRSLPRAFGLLLLTAFFFLATLLIMRGTWEFRGVGFRSAVAFSATFWISSFMTVIGLYGMNRRWIWTGVLGSSLFAALVFWTQLFPLWESRRLSRQAVSAIEKKLDEQPLSVKIASTPGAQLMPVLFSLKPRTLPSQDSGSTILLLSDKTLDGPSLEVDTLRGWDDGLRAATWYLYQGQDPLK